MLDIGGISVPFVPIGGETSLSKTAKNILPVASSGVKFSDYMEQALIKFSSQAQNNMVKNEVNLDEIEMLRLDEAIDKARYKDLRDTLVLLDDKMFVVDVDSNTVINIFDRNAVGNNLITGIDSLVVG